jgi:hypothetical protein
VAVSFNVYLEVLDGCILDTDPTVEIGIGGLASKTPLFNVSGYFASGFNLNFESASRQIFKHS